MASGMEVDNSEGTPFNPFLNQDWDSEQQQVSPGWLYPMRRKMQEILPGLFLGPGASAYKYSLNHMLDMGLTHVVCVRSSKESPLIKPFHPGVFQYLELTMGDSKLEPVITQVKTAAAFIDTCLNAGGKVLVHGKDGMTRSAALVVGYVMGKFGVSFRKARNYVASKRGCIYVDKEPYAYQLKQYEYIVNAVHMTPMPRPSESGPTINRAQLLKRSIDEEEDDGQWNMVTRPKMGTGEDRMDLD